jgi:hypothetical protein
MEAFRQDVHQEAADELVCRECHELVPLGTLDPVVLVSSSTRRLGVPSRQAHAPHAHSGASPALRPPGQRYPRRQRRQSARLAERSEAGRDPGRSQIC